MFDYIIRLTKISEGYKVTVETKTDSKSIIVKSLSEIDNLLKEWFNYD